MNNYLIECKYSIKNNKTNGFCEKNINFFIHNILIVKKVNINIFQKPIITFIIKNITLFYTQNIAVK